MQQLGDQFSLGCAALHEDLQGGCGSLKTGARSELDFLGRVHI